MFGRARGVVGFLALPILLAGCSALSDFGGYRFPESTAADGGTADGGGTGGSGGSGGAGDGGGAACTTDADCDDDNACNGRETCGDDGTCDPGKSVACPALDDACRKNVCVTMTGQARCVARAANEGDACADGDDTDTAADSCARDYVCNKGECAAETVEMCEPTQCQLRAGCDAKTGCRFAPRAASRDCDDDDPCTVDDKCSGVDGTCAGAPKDCADAVGCTVDTCDGGNCVHTASDAKCDEACRSGVCDAVMDCGTWTNEVDFTDCDDSDGATTPDFCYRGACVGGTKGEPTASCAVGGCMCSGWGAAKDLEYLGSKFVGMFDATHAGAGGGCTSGTVAIVYDVTQDALTHYTTDTAGGAAVAGSGADLLLGFAVASGNVGELDTTARTVDWLGNAMATALANGTPSLVNFQGASRHREGAFLGGDTHVWFWGDDTATPSTGRLVRCSWTTTCGGMGCSDGATTCVYQNAFLTATFFGVSPYTEATGLISTTYRGALAVVNTDSGSPTRRIYVDSTSPDHSISTVERSDTSGTWAGSLLYTSGKALAFGLGSENLVVCDDSDLDGDPACAAVSGLPNQASRAYYDAAVTSGGGLALLGTTCASGGLCLSGSHYLTVCPAGVDPTQGSNWREFFLGSFTALGGTNAYANEVAASPDTLMVLGTHGGVPYVWTWGP